MNKFGQRDAQELVDELRSKAVASGEGELKRLLTDAADTIAAGDRYYCTVEGALA